MAFPYHDRAPCESAAAVPFADELTIHPSFYRYCNTLADRWAGFERELITKDEETCWFYYCIFTLRHRLFAFLQVIEYRPVPRFVLPFHLPPRLLSVRVTVSRMNLHQCQSGRCRCIEGKWGKSRGRGVEMSAACVLNSHRVEQYLLPV